MSGLRKGTKVNYERSTRYGDEIGGHTVSGHVSCRAVVSEVKDHKDSNTRKLTFELPDERWMKYILPKVGDILPCTILRCVLEGMNPVPITADGGLLLALVAGLGA